MPRPNAAERRAAWWYRLHGYRILDRNAWAGGYELDVVAARRGTVVFCEVKSKTDARFCDPLEMLTDEKVRRVRRAAEAWLVRHREFAGRDVRFDAVVVRGKVLEQIPNAF